MPPSLHFAKISLHLPQMQGERPVRWGLPAPPRIHVFCRHVETRRKCPLTAGFSNASFESLVLRKGRRPISDLSLCGKKSRSWRRKGVVARASPTSCRCWMRAASEIRKYEDWNQGCFSQRVGWDRLAFGRAQAVEAFDEIAQTRDLGVERLFIRHRGIDHH